LEIPQAMRDLAEQSIKQAHAAYEQLTDFVTKAMGAWMGAVSKQNAESAFALVDKITKAQNFQEILTLQTRFAQDQMPRRRRSFTS